MTTSIHSRWLTNHSLQRGRVRLFCFPYAGGGSAVYYPWRQALHPEIELLLIHLPGRESRLREPLVTDFSELAETLADRLAPEAACTPFAFFGHSMGALVAFEVARQMRRRHALSPRHLFLSAFRGAHLPDRDPPCADLPEAAFIDRLRQYQGIPDLVVQDEELRELFLPILRADFKVLESYSYREEPPLDCPITTFGGLDDRKFGWQDIEQWRRHTTRELTSYYYGGGHFFLHQCKEQLIARINEVLVR